MINRFCMFYRLFDVMEIKKILSGVHILRKFFFSIKMMSVINYKFSFIFLKYIYAHRKPWGLNRNPFYHSFYSQNSLQNKFPIMWFKEEKLISVTSDECWIGFIYLSVLRISVFDLTGLIYWLSLTLEFSIYLIRISPCSVFFMVTKWKTKYFNFLCKLRVLIIFK